MSIDLSDIESSKKLIEILGLSGKKFHTLSAESLLTNTWDFVCKIWEEANDTSFTQHNKTHSLRIIEFFLDFDKYFNWSDYSKLIFTVSALIHDIGMQYKYWNFKQLEEILEGGRRVFPDQNTITNTEIRERHCELGFNFIKYQIFNENNIKFPWNIRTQECFDDALYHAMYIAFSHSSKSVYFDELKNNEWKKNADPDIGYNPRLLACILRLSDEFDCDHRRIIYERINNPSLDEKGRLQWLTCHYIQKSHLINAVDGEFSNPMLEITWRVPVVCSNYDKKTIKNFLIKNRILKTKGEIQKIKDFLLEVKDESYSKLKFLDVNNLDDEPQKNADAKIDSEKRVLLLKSTYSRSNIDSNSVESFNESLLGKDLISEKKRIEKELEDWFYKNIDPNHYFLGTDEHTDIYLNCRTMITNQALLRDIGKFLNDCFQIMNEPIDCVLAIGTSSIPIATNYQVFSESKMTFTMSPAKETPPTNNGNNYIRTEMIPLLFNCKRVLIIDDIISNGEIAKKIIKNYLEKKGIEKIFHFSLFRLGNREIVKIPEVKKYFWLCHIPWVSYFEPPFEENCDLCKEKIPIKSEFELY